MGSGKKGKKGERSGKWDVLLRNGCGDGDEGSSFWNGWGIY